MTCANPFEASDGVWLKVNLHTHTTASDGTHSLEERIAEYREAGYDALAITDHRVVTPVRKRALDGFLVIQGIEMHPACPGGDLYHLVALNVPADFPYDESAGPNALVRSVRERGGEVVFAHPYWCGHTPDQIMAVEGLAAVEVYNATCTKIGKGCSSVIWDYLLDAGRWLPAVAVDDTHGGRDIFMGWTMLRVRERSVAGILEALRTGAGYSSSGPMIHDLRVADGRARVACSPASEIHFMCRRSRGRSFYSDGGVPLTEAEIAVSPGTGYLRVEVVDAQGRRAWSNPITIPPGV
ncbi:MAG: CehA/McbA family metallohydrolase [Kiritimatiellaeota bacterium]|nr:CehA/McbA family metallohydrolase [Kiritimatiellota bacterium]